ncbi:hypothetical protein AB0K21_16450 [Streptosporangium sp. NPDC049248]|uniref:hypothetical protein n=1 Tax=Streptosporangium sp. NPDC049248 TaxID=3155651 RepID=UPI003449E972
MGQRSARSFGTATARAAADRDRPQAAGPVGGRRRARYGGAARRALLLNGKAAAANTIQRKRAVFYNALQYAVELEELPANPVKVAVGFPS